MQQATKPTITLWGALLPVVILVLLLSFNVTVYGDDALGGSNQFILLIGAAVAAIVGFRNKVTYDQMIEAIGSNLKSTTGAILILLFVGALAGTWLLSGIIPAMIYYGLQILHPVFSYLHVLSFVPSFRLQLGVVGRLLLPLESL